MKNVTDFRKTVETCVGPRLSRIQKRLIINLKKTCILKETHRTPYWFQNCKFLAKNAMLKLRNSGRMVDPVKTNYSVLPLFSSVGVAIYHTVK